jgi:urea transport system permease protein
VMAFPNGLAGLYNTYVAPKVKPFFAKLSAPRKPVMEKPSTLNEGALHDPQ